MDNKYLKKPDSEINNKCYKYLDNEDLKKSLIDISEKYIASKEQYEEIKIKQEDIDNEKIMMLYDKKAELEKLNKYYTGKEFAKISSQ